MSDKPEKLSPVEGVKAKSNFLRGDIAKELVDANDFFGKASVNLLKTHGTYQQDDRDARKEVRKEAGAKPRAKLISYMVRARIPGGKLTAKQFLAQLDLCDEIGNTTLRVTTRQGIQLHGILKRNLHAAINRINEIQLTTLAACGDVVRNVMCNPAPFVGPLHQEVQAFADKLSTYFLPRTKGYHEIWVSSGDVNDENGDRQLVAGGDPETIEPIYGATYLPRKFKIAVGLPENNSTDIYSNDIGFIAVHDGQKILGYNVIAGGGMGVTPSAKKTFPALAHEICFATPEQVLDVGTAIVKVQRDFGNRADRKVARLKYTIANMGLEAFRAKVAEYAGFALTPTKLVTMSVATDDLGWNQQGDGKWFYGLYVENGRVKDEDAYRLKSALRAILTKYQPEVRLTAHQNVIFCNIAAEDRAGYTAILREHGVPLTEDLTPVRRLSMACPALPTCSLAVADSERIHPQLMDGIDAKLAELGLAEEVFATHMTGCPNGCARPYSSDLGIVGKTLGKYTIFLGGNVLGTRLSFIYRDLVPLDEVLPVLTPVFERFRDERNPGEKFGDFCHRLGSEGLGAEAAAVVEGEEDGE
ncbi:MAG TPA: NADPH-dependent assimilatory sulfite reductase hemoprotein subunit [Pirellulales bacterium]